MSARSTSVGRVLVGLSHAAIMIFPLAVWLDADHFASGEWFIHAKFHLLWKLMLTSMAGATGLWLVFRRWEETALRGLVVAAPIVLWATHILSHAIMILSFDDDAFPHHAKLIAGISGADLAIVATLLVAIVGAASSRSARVPSPCRP